MTAPAATALAVAQQRRLALLSRTVVDRAQEMWAKVHPGDISGSWDQQVPNLVRTVAVAQIVAVTQADEYLTLTAPDDAAPALNPAGFAGTTADGRTLTGLFSLPPITAKLRIGQGVPVEDALMSALAQLLLGVQTEVADASRDATQVGMATRPRVRGYVRVVQAGACGRCLILAGRVYRYSHGFLRHPACHCSMSPFGSAEADMAPDPMALFRSMTPAQQVDSLGSEGAAAAVRAGADLGQVVNANSGLFVAGGRKFTTTGTTKHGRAPGLQRPTPAQLFADHGEDRAALVASLRRFGYVT